MHLRCIMKILGYSLIFLNSFLLAAQIANREHDLYPIFEECENLERIKLEACFTQTLKDFMFRNFQTPFKMSNEHYRGAINVLFEVSKTGEFLVLYVDSPYLELKEEAIRVFGLLPNVEPATYNGKPTYVQFTLPIDLPLIPPRKNLLLENKEIEEIKSKDLLAREYDAIRNLSYANDEYHSNINIPLSHQVYSRFDPEMNRVGINNHTSQKPYIYSEVNKYYDFAAENKKLQINKSSWFGRKWWNEHLVTINGDGYWLTLDAGVDLQVGKDFNSQQDIDTYNNTRIVYTQGGLGKSFSFFGVIYESQGRFADYFNRYAESIRPDGGNPAIIPAQGIAKEFKKDSYDYPVATGHISYTPSEYFNLQFGHGKTFIGDGYRSLLFSDNASSYPFFKINTTFWKLKYTNTWMSLRDVRPEVTDRGSFRTKYVASHYLSYNITKRLNIGLFESVVWQNDNGRGFDMNYWNPIIFYRAIEFSTGSRGGNALIGLSAKYKFSDRVNAYGQFIIDEFSSSDVFGGNGSYKNKTGYQIGLKYYEAFGIENLILQSEYNRIRPYTYSHISVILNYAHNNQPLAHTLGANFSELIMIGRYQKGRIYGDLKFIIAKRGFEFNTEEDSSFYGSDIYGTEKDRIYTDGNKLAQGNTSDFFHGELQAGFIVNPANNFKIYASVLYRSLKPKIDTELVFKENSTWINFGIRTDLFNWYYDF